MADKTHKTKTYILHYNQRISLCFVLNEFSIKKGVFNLVFLSRKTASRLIYNHRFLKTAFLNLIFLFIQQWRQGRFHANLLASFLAKLRRLTENVTIFALQLKQDASVF